MTQWYYRMGGEVIGPVTPEELRRQVDDRSIIEDMEVKNGEDGDWKFASTVDGWFDDADGYRQKELERERRKIEAEVRAKLEKDHKEPESTGGDALQVGPYISELDITHGRGKGRPKLVASLIFLALAAVPSLIVAVLYSRLVGKSFAEIFNETEGQLDKIDSHLDFMMICFTLTGLVALFFIVKLADWYQARNPNVWWYFRHPHDYCMTCQGKWEVVSRSPVGGRWVRHAFLQHVWWHRKLRVVQTVRCGVCQREEVREAIIHQHGHGEYPGQKRPPEGGGGG